MHLFKKNWIPAVLAAAFVLVASLLWLAAKDRRDSQSSLRVTGWNRLHVGESDIYSVFTTPKSPNLVYAVAFGAGGFFVGLRMTYKSTDAGATWVLVRRDLELLTIDPAHPQKLYGESSRQTVVESMDAGKSWSPLGLPRASVVTAFAIDPSSSQTLYATDGGGVLKSTNGGKRWRQLRLDREETQAQLAIDPARPRVLYLLLRAVSKQPAAGAGVLKSTDGGRSWHRTGLWDLVADINLTNDPHDIAIEIDSRKPHTLYALDNFSVYKSTDGGSRWTTLGFRPPFSLFLVSALAIDRSKPNTVYVAGSHGEDQDFVLKSTTGGKTWTVVARLRAHPQEDPDASIRFTTLAVDPTGRRVYAGTDAGIFVCKTCWKIKSPARRRH